MRTISVQSPRREGGGCHQWVQGGVALCWGGDACGVPAQHPRTQRCQPGCREQAWSLSSFFLFGPQEPLLPAPHAPCGLWLPGLPTLLSLPLLRLVPCPGRSQAVSWASLGAHLSGILSVAARWSVFAPEEAQSHPGPPSVTEAPSPALVGGGAGSRAAPRFWTSGRRRARWRGSGL